MTRTLAAPLMLLSLALPPAMVDAQSVTYSGPIIDVHLHGGSISEWGVEPPVGICAPFSHFRTRDPAQPYREFFGERYLKGPPCPEPVWSPESDAEVIRQTLDAMEQYNMIGVVSSSPDDVAAWRAEAPERMISGIYFNLGTEDRPSPDSLRSLVATGAVEVFGEIGNAYAGIAPDDPRMEPYWALAEELDVPVAIHVGGGPPGEPYAGHGYRARLESPLTMEEVLVRHPRMRVYLMHAGYPMLDDLLAVLTLHPQVYVDVGAIVYTLPPEEFYRYLRGIVQAGFGRRVMFGSDQMIWPQTIERSIAVVEQASFLSAEQKADIFYNNAARFLRLSEEEIARHHAMTDQAGGRR